MAILNMVGASASDAYAYIKVYYDGGATLTCSDGTTTLTAPETSAGNLVAYVFAVPNSGTWTVTEVDSIDTVTRTVSITSPYQVETIYCFYKVLWGDGVITESDWTFAAKGYNSSFTAGYAPTHSVSGGVMDLYESVPSSTVRAGLAYYTSAQNLSYYKTLSMTGTIYNGDTAEDGCGLKIYSSIGTYTTSNVIASADVGARSTTITNPSIDISSLTNSSVYIGISLISKNGATSSTRGHASVTKLVLK